MSESKIAEARLSILLDVRHPLAYLALRPAVAMAREVGAEVDWLPVVAGPLKRPSAPGADDDRGVRHRRARAQAIAREVEVYSAGQNLVLKEIYRAPDPAALNLGWLWLRERQSERLEAFLLEAFRAYWALELDPSSPSEVATLLNAVDADGAEFQAWAAGDGPSVASRLADELHERGLSRTPCYLVGEEVFVGRQHLPMVRWILEGRTGRVPI